MIATAALTAIPTYYAAPWATRKLINTVLPPNLRAEAEAELNNPEQFSKFRNRVTAASALLATLAHAYTTYTPSKGWGSFTKWSSAKDLSSNLNLLQKEAIYYNPTPSAFADPRTGYTVNNLPPGSFPPIPFNENTAPLYGVGSSSIGGDVDALIETPIVPLRHASELILNDKYLNPRQKGVILNIFENARGEGKSGLVSVTDLASAAVRAGLGYAAGSTAGLVLGSLFALPTPVTQQLSRMGGIANAVINTGVVGI